MQETQAKPENSEQAAGLADQAQTLAASLTQTAKDKASGVVSGLVEEQKAAAAEQVEGVARLLDDVSGRVEQGAPAIAPILRGAASSVRRVSSSLRDRSVDEVLQGLSEFARRRPATLIGASLIGGFALARFLKSSADRHASGRQGASRSQRPESPAADQPSAGTASHPPRSAEHPEATLPHVASPAASAGAVAAVSPRTADKPAGVTSAGGGAEASDKASI